MSAEESEFDVWRRGHDRATRAAAAELDEAEEARRVLRNLGVEDAGRVTLAAGVGRAIELVVLRHSAFLNQMAGELVVRGVPPEDVHGAAAAAGRVLLERSREATR